MKFSRQKMQHLKWVRRKELIRINCFIMVAILLMVLLFMGFPIVSNAESAYTYDDTLPAHLGINEDSLLTYDNVDQEENYTYFLYDNTVYSRYFDDDLSNGYIVWDSRIDTFTYSDLSISDSISYYAYFQSESDFYIDYYFVDLECKFFKESANSSLHCLYSYPNEYRVFPNPNKLIRLRFTKSNDGNFYLYNGYPMGYNNVFNFGQQYTNGDYDAFANFAVQNPILTNVNVYSLPTSPYLQKNSYTNGDVTVNDWVNADNGIQINPNISNGTNNLNDIKDHLTLYENSSCYLVPTSFKDGTFYIYANFDEYQLNPNNNIYVTLTVSCSYNLYKNNGGTYDVKTSNGQNILNLFNVSNQSTNFSTVYGKSYPVSDFKNGKLEIPLSTINDSLKFSNGYTAVSLAEGYSAAGIQGNLWTSFVQTIGGITTNGVQYNVSGAYNGQLKCVLEGCNYHFDIALVQINGYGEDDLNPEAFSLAYDYDFVLGQGNLNYSNLADNEKVQQATDSQSIPPDYYHDVNKPTYDNTLPSSNNNDNSSSSNSNSSDNITVSGGDNSINNIVNVNQGNKYPEKGVMNSFVRIINNDKNNTVNDIDTLIGGSAYIQLMNNALVAVPDQVWSIWITALKAILGIAVSAFFLKILINWAT